MSEPNEAQWNWIGRVLGVARAGAAKLPSAAEAAQRYEGKRAAKGGNDDASPATQVDSSKSPVQPDDSRLSPDVEFEKLHEDLKGKLRQEFWAGLGKQQRWTLVETFRRMNGYGLWKEVKAVIGEKEQPEKHVAFGGYEFQVAGNSGGIVYEAVSAKSLVGKMKSTSNFGEDGSLIGAMHKGQISMREWSSDSMSLHVSVGPGNNFDAHIDKVSPTKKPEGGKTRIDPAKGMEHQTQELWPEFIRKVTKIPGVIVEGSANENKETRHGEVKVGVKVEVRGPVEKTKPKLDQSKPRPNAVPDKVMAKILQRVERMKNSFPVPIGSVPAEVPLPKDLAGELAAQILEAGRNGKDSVQFDVPYYRDKKDDQAKALDAMQEIGQIARSEIGTAADSVTRLTVTFGSAKQGGTVSIAD